MSDKLIFMSIQLVPFVNMLLAMCMLLGAANRHRAGVKSWLVILLLVAYLFGGVIYHYWRIMIYGQALLG